MGIVADLKPLELLEGREECRSKTHLGVNCEGQSLTKSTEKTW